MSAAVIAGDVAEGLSLVTNLLQAATAVSSSMQTAAATGQPFSLEQVLSDEAQAENGVLKAIAQARAAGR